MNRNKKIFFSLFSLFILLGISFLPLFVPVAHAQTQVWGGVCVHETADGDRVATIQGLQCLIGNVLSVAVSGIGLVGFVMMIIGAFRYLASAGNAKGVEGARNTILFALIGLITALSAFMILNLIASFTGVESILNFKIPS